MSSTAASTADGTADVDRLAAVRRYEILDAPRDGAFDRVARMAAAVFGAPVATVSIVDEERVWFAATTGLDGVTEVGTEPGLCASAVTVDGPYVVNDALVDPRTIAHPLVRGDLGLRFYAAAPIVTPNGHCLGTVNVIDREPREVTPTQLTMLAELAGLVMEHLELRLAAIHAVRAERELLDAANSRAEYSTELATQLRAAAAAARDRDRPATCQLGGRQACQRAAEIKVADSWGDSAWGCPEHVEEAILNVSSTFIADLTLGGLGAFTRR